MKERERERKKGEKMKGEYLSLIIYPEKNSFFFLSLYFLILDFLKNQFFLLSSPLFQSSEIFHTRRNHSRKHFWEEKVEEEERGCRLLIALISLLSTIIKIFKNLI